MDAASSALLAALAGMLAASSWVVLVSRRDEATGFAADPGPQVCKLNLEPLALDATLALADALSEPRPLTPHLVATAAERSDGNPQFLIDLLDAIAAGGEASLPDSVESAALRRIDTLAVADRSLVRRASVLGVSFHPRQLSDVLEPGIPLPDAATWERLSPLFEDEGEGYVRFRRPTLRDAAYAGLPFRVRRALHRAIGDRLERELGAGSDADPAVLSLHLAAAGEHERAGRHAWAAARLAVERYAYVDAARLYRRAIETNSLLGAPPAELADCWEALGEALWRTGDTAEACDAYSRARRFVTGDTLREAQLIHLQAGVTSRAGRVTASVRWINRGLKLLAGDGRRDAAALRARLTSMLAGVRQRQGRCGEAVSLCEAAIAEAEAAGDDRALAHACYVLDFALIELGRPAEATHSARALAIYQRLGDIENESRVVNNIAAYAFFAGRWREAAKRYAEGAELARRAGDLTSSAYGECNLGELLADQGRIEEAEPRLRRALQIWRATGDDHGVAFATLLLGRVAVRSGRAREGIVLLENARDELRRLRVESDTRLAEALLAEAAVYAGEPTAALSIIESMAPDVRRESPLVMRTRGLALAAAGDAAGAASELRSSLAAARERGSDFDVAVALDALAEVGAPGSARDRRAERDAIVERLGIAALPVLPPVAAAGRAGLAAAG